jgi:phage minor structural protein|nr:MAG TPA: Neck appendage protein [Caudoviricetes sp.]
MIYLLENNFPLNAAYDDEIIQEANSTYQLTFKFPTTDSKWTELKNEVLLVADDLHGEQYFSIFEVEKQHGYITVYANQVATLLNSYSINTISVDRVNGFTVMNALVSALKRPSPFTFFSDISSKHTINLKNVSVMEALVKDKHSIVGQWGGDLVRDKYSIRLLERAGVENESLFAYKKNMKSYQESASTKELKTRIHFRRVIESHDEHKKDQVFTATIDSPLIGKYKNIYEADMEVQDQDVVDQKTLEEYGKRYFRETLCDMVEESLEIDVIGQTDQPVSLFDTVSVFHERYNVDLRKKITKYRFKPMRKKLVSIGFGKVSQSFGSALGSLVENKVNEQLDEKLSGRDKEYEAKVQKLVDNANAEYSKKATALEQEITDGIEQAKAQAEAVKKLISNDIERRFQEFGSNDLEEVRRKADEALRKAGTLPDAASLSASVKREILASPDLTQKVSETIQQTDSGTIYNKIYQNIKHDFTAMDEIGPVLAGINQQIKSQTVEFQKLAESNKLYERIIGTSETDAPDKLSRLVMSSEIFQSEVGKYAKDDFNLVYDPTNFSKWKKKQPEANVVEVQASTKLLRITNSGHTNNVYRGFALPITTSSFTKDEKLSYRIEAWVDVLPNAPLGIELWNNNSVIASDRVTFTKTGTQIITGTMTVNKTTTNLRDFPLEFWLMKNGTVAIGKVSLIRGDRPPNKFTDNTSTQDVATQTQVTQLAGSYAIKNLNSAGDIINGINIGANGNNRIDGRLTHITGQTLIDNAVIKSAMVDKLKTGNFESGSVTTQILASNAVTADKLLVDAAMINKLVTNQAFIRELVSQKAFITQLNSIDVAAKRFTGERVQSSDGSLVLDLIKNQLTMTSDTAAITREQAGFPTQFMRYESSVENGHKHAKTIIGSNRDGSKSWNSPSFAGIVIDNNANSTLDNIYQFGDHIHFKHSQGDDGWRFSNVSQVITPGVWNKKSEIWARSFVVPRETRGLTDTPTKFINLVDSVAALWKLWAHAKGQMSMTGAMQTVVQGSLDAWGYSRPHI